MTKGAKNEVGQCAIASLCEKMVQKIKGSKYPSIKKISKNKMQKIRWVNELQHLDGEKKSAKNKGVKEP